MHPELLNNSLFIRYYKQWQDDPGSIVFAPIAEFFIMYGMIDPAFKICREGLKKHPDFVSGRIVMARIHLKRDNWEEAENELRHVLSLVSDNSTARQMMEEIEVLRRAEREGGRLAREEAHGNRGQDVAADAKWRTVTMARILASQGHREKAREIYQSILSQDPANDAARQGIAALDPVA